MADSNNLSCNVDVDVDGDFINESYNTDDLRFGGVDVGVVVGVTEVLPKYLDDVMAEMKQKELEEKFEKQVLSAKRSLVTNLSVAALFASGIVLIVVLPKPVNIIWNVTSAMVVKGATPIVTIIANFGTVQSVLYQYLKR